MVREYKHRAHFLSCRRPPAVKLFYINISLKLEPTREFDGKKRRRRGSTYGELAKSEKEKYFSTVYESLGL